MNKVILIGRIVKNPDLKQIPNSQTQVGNFTIAVDNPFKKDSTGNNTADFIPIVTFGKTAEFVSKYFTKGLRVAVSGRIQTRNWKDQQNVVHYATEVIADSVEFADGKANTNINNNETINNPNIITDPNSNSDTLPF